MSGLRIDGVANKIIVFAVLFLSFIVSRVEAQSNFRVMFYNPENLYDTKDNPNTNDDDLTPTGNLRWNKYKYYKKLENISKVLIAVGGKYPPALVGLCEVETDSVLYDLTRRTVLKKHSYEYIITNSKDFRGSNVALLYQRDQIKILKTQTYTPRITPDFSRTTRDILHVMGRVVSGDTLDIFVCHFPSRSEGIKKSRPYRIVCASLLRQKADSLFSIRRKANIIIMGDFNDYPTDASMSETLSARSVEAVIEPKQLYNMFYRQTKDKDSGSYRYRGKWNYLDQFVVSGNLLGKKGNVRIADGLAQVYKADFLLEADKKYGGQKPFRTYSGFKYLGGFSDHLPVYMDLLIKE